MPPSTATAQPGDVLPASRPPGPQATTGIAAVPHPNVENGCLALLSSPQAWGPWDRLGSSALAWSHLGNVTEGPWSPPGRCKPTRLLIVHPLGAHKAQRHPDSTHESTSGKLPHTESSPVRLTESRAWLTQKHWLGPSWCRGRRGGPDTREAQRLPPARPRPAGC